MPAHADQCVRSRLPHRHGKQSSVACKLPAEVIHAAHTFAHLLASGSFSNAVCFTSLLPTAPCVLWSVIWLCQSPSGPTIDQQDWLEDTHTALTFKPGSGPSNSTAVGTAGNQPICFYVLVLVEQHIIKNLKYQTWFSFRRQLLLVEQHTAVGVVYAGGGGRRGAHVWGPSAGSPAGTSWHQHHSHC